jgi:hypothetical protein
MASTIRECLYSNFPTPYVTESDKTLSQKHWTTEFSLIHKYNVYSPTLESLDSMFGPEDAADAIRLEKEFDSTKILAEVLETEGDVVRVFHAHIGQFVRQAIGSLPTTFERSEAKPQGNFGDNVFIDSQFQVMLTGSLYVAACGEMKAPGILDREMWNQQLKHSSKTMNLGRELRAYVHNIMDDTLLHFIDMLLPMGLHTCFALMELHCC